VALADDLAARGWPVAVLATPPRRTPPGREGAGHDFPQANRDFNVRLAALLAAQRAHRWIDARDPLRDPARPPADGDWLAPAYAADHTHLTADGYRAFATAVAAALLAP
jgi:lysophospholipase L1-like esterase